MAVSSLSGQDRSVATARARGKVPNDVFKRPGPHHAVHVDLDRLELLRAAALPMQRFGDVRPLALLTGRTPDDLSRPYALAGVPYDYLAHGEDDFGLEVFGPILSRAEISTVFGEPVIPHVEPMSPFWLARRHSFPERVLPAREILEHVDELRTITPQRWELIYRDMTSRTDEAEELDEIRLKSEREARELIPRWREELPMEVQSFERRLRELARRDAWVMNWESSEGWL